MMILGGFYEPSNENVQNSSSLMFLVEAVKSDIFGIDLYPNIYIKASAYMSFIINDHIFFDGNKRTGTLSAITFLGMNGILLNENIGNKEIEELAMDVANNRMSLKNLETWFKNNTY